MPESRDSYKRESDSADRDREERRKKRRSRWGGDEKDKAFILGMPTVLPTNLSKEQEEAYLLQLQIEEVSRKLRTGELGIPPNPEDRSPSPEPIYSSDGKRLNTREYRTRKKLEEERHNLIQQMLKLNPDFKPPADYKPPIIRVSDKVMIPQDDHPDINFVGLLIGPRGNTLKSMERDTGAKIIIRGKGSVKEGKVGRKDGQPLPGEDEPLHAYVTANNPECVKKAVDKIKEIIRQGVEVPEGQNDLRRMQLRELALLNGTLRENDGPRCSNCGSSEHKSWMCPDKPNVTNNIVCSSCGGAGHIAKDCRQKRPGAVRDPTVVMHDKAKIDEEESYIPTINNAEVSTAQVETRIKTECSVDYPAEEEEEVGIKAIKVEKEEYEDTEEEEEEEEEEKEVVEEEEEEVDGRGGATGEDVRAVKREELQARCDVKRETNVGEFGENEVEETTKFEINQVPVADSVPPDVDNESAFEPRELLQSTQRTKKRKLSDILRNELEEKFKRAQTLNRQQQIVHPLMKEKLQSEMELAKIKTEAVQQQMQQTKELFLFDMAKKDQEAKHAEKAFLAEMAYKERKWELELQLLQKQLIIMYMSLMAELGEGPPPPVSSSSDRSHSIMTTSSSGGLFDRQMAPRAITAAPPPPMPTTTPTQLIPNTLPPPPWSQQPPPPKANLTQPPPPTPISTTSTLTLPHPPWQATAATLTTSIPPPILTASLPPPIQTQHPPPPPLPQQQQQINVASLLSWMQQPQLTQTIMQQQPPPPPRPIPPPVAATTSLPPPPALPPWQQSIPPPSQPPPTPAFWTQNYVMPPPPSTAAAPPPVRQQTVPPPPPSFHTLFQSQPPPPGIDPSPKP